MLYDSDGLTKQNYHCVQCGLCRQGGSQNYTHCTICNACVLKANYARHKHIENALNTNCPICLDDNLFRSQHPSIYLNCGHTMHKHCFRQLTRHKFQCPLCQRSFCDMWHQNRQLDSEIENMPMPAELLARQVHVLCNDCGERSHCSFHLLGYKCLSCFSYNTRVI